MITKLKKQINNLWLIQKKLKSNSANSYIIKAILNLEDTIKEENALKVINEKMKGDEK
jgi:hypothetical protein